MLMERSIPRAHYQQSYKPSMTAARISYALIDRTHTLCERHTDW